MGVAKMFTWVIFLVFISQSRTQSQELSRFCNCQCSHLTWQYVWNNFGWHVSVIHPSSHHYHHQPNIYGNCHSGSPTRWCYVDPQHSDCPVFFIFKINRFWKNKIFKDLEESTLFYGQKVSSEACYTTSTNSPECNIRIPLYRTEAREHCEIIVVQGENRRQCSQMSVQVPNYKNCRRGLYYSTNMGRCVSRTRGGGRTV